jgi:hypothetical protein
MKHISIVFEDLRSQEIQDYLEKGELWLKDSPNNRKLSDEIISENALKEPPCLSRFSDKASVADILEEVFDHYHEGGFDGPYSGPWGTIVVRGPKREAIESFLEDDQTILVSEREKEIWLKHA